MPLHGTIPRQHLPRPSPLPNTVHYGSEAAPQQPDWDLRDDEFEDAALAAGNDDGGGTSSFGTSEGAPSCSDDGAVIFRAPSV